MEMLNVLGQKIEALIAMTKELQVRNRQLEMTVENLKATNATYEEENVRLMSQVELLSSSSRREHEEIGSLQQERERAREAVDSLLSKIKTIDVLAECD